MQRGKLKKVGVFLLASVILVSNALQMNSVVYAEEPTEILKETEQETLESETVQDGAEQWESEVLDETEVEIQKAEEVQQETEQGGESRKLSTISLIADPQTKENELNVNLQLKGATYFDGTPWTGTPQKMVEYKEVEVPYNGWQLMQLTVEISYQEGVEVTGIQPSVETVYPEYSKLEKDDENSQWTYTFYFYNNGTYDFTVNYTLNGVEKSTVQSYTVEGLVSIKDAAMRRHLIHQYGEQTGISYNRGQYITEESLATPLYDPWGNLFFDFGKDGDNGSTAQYTTSLDGLQYLTNIHGMYLFECSNLVAGETIEPITYTEYPNMKSFRLTEITENRNDLPPGSYTPEMISAAIANMPNLDELSISGTGFVDLPVIGQLNGQLVYLEADYNEIESVMGIETHRNLQMISLGMNKIKSIQPFENADLREVTFMDLSGNQIFDLRPLYDTLNKDIVGGKRLGVLRQTIIYDKTVIANLKGDIYEIELPMPIDIDGSLTDTAKVKVTSLDGSTKDYNTIKNDGKTYISIPKADVDSTKENPFENMKFEFSFDNKNGVDTRTKAGFSGTVTFKVSPFAEQYHVLYEFVSGTRGKSLPQEVTDLLPIDPSKYVEGTTITAIQPDKTEIKVSDGVWIFKGYDADNKLANPDNADKKRNVTFTGTWEFTVNKYTVDYSFESKTKDKELPKEITDQLPETGSVEHGKTVKPSIETFADVKVSDGVWTFKGWTPAKHENVTDDVEFVGAWEFKKNASIINQAPTISASDKTLTVGDEFNPFQDVTATDKEDGDLTKEIEILKNEVDTKKAGVYEVTYKVTDSQGASSTKTIYVTVNPKMEELNHIPTINVSDKTLTVGDKFEPFQDVTATDKEDGDLTKEIEILKNEVDTDKAGIYEVTYKVTDSKSASSVKTIKVTVKDKDKPVVPSEPDKPTKPDTEKPNDSGSVETGDKTNMTLWTILLLVSGIGAIGVYRKKKRISQ